MAGARSGLRFKGYIKEHCRKEFSKIALSGEWDGGNSPSHKMRKTENFRAFAKNQRAIFIPLGSVQDMPSSWLDNEGNATDGFELEYDESSGYWAFQCSLKNYSNTIEKFIDIVPEICSKVEHLEYYDTDWSSSRIYGLGVNKTYILREETLL